MEYIKEVDMHEHILKMIGSDDYQKLIDQQECSFKAGAMWGAAMAAVYVAANAPKHILSEICHCKDCIYRDETIPGQPNILCGQMKDDDFCSYGQRK